MPGIAERIAEVAAAAERDNVAIDGSNGGPVHRWIMDNVNHRADQTFYLVLLITAELSDRAARREGYEDQMDRAAARVFKK